MKASPAATSPATADTGRIRLGAGWRMPTKPVRENFQASLRDALSVPPYPALKALGYFQTPLRGANPTRSSHSADEHLPNNGQLLTKKHS